MSSGFMAGYGVMTTFSPLTISGRPYFYYVCFLAKKGLVSETPRVTNVVSVLIPLFNESPWLYRPYEMTIIFPFNGHFVDGGKKWE
jgi:hypothetical protein